MKIAWNTRRIVEFGALGLGLAWALPAVSVCAQPEVASPPTAAETPAESEPPASVEPVRANTAPSEPTRSAPAAAPFTFRVGDTVFHPQLQVRARGEVRIDPYATPAPLDSEAHFVTSRFRVGLSIDHHDVRVVFQAQDARNFGTAAPGVDPGGSFGVHQAYGEYHRDGSFVRVGRQEIAYGDERLVGPLDWTSNARAFDAVRGHLAHGILELDAVGAIVTQAAEYTYAGPPVSTRPSDGDFFAAAQLALSPVEAFRVQALYLYRRDRRDASSATRDRKISAGSLRLSGTPAPRTTYVAEVVVEWGEILGERMLAYAAAADVAYTTDTERAATIATGFALGSGERTGKVAEFENFFPTNHKFYGFADLFGLRNLVEGHATWQQRYGARQLGTFVSTHAFFLERTDARWTSATGALIAPAVAGDERYLGFEIDAGGSYRFGELVSLSGGYSLFVPGSAAERLGQDDVQHWAWLMLDFRTP